ncbi:MAG: group I intron-associated PD-(D/E)XK endonuclease [Nostoc sp.]|uniref:group I intron-associated PD-(D/E)XK endonuclease n=1 Tax=Nostoc sp. TaxID=1180 RepID=UPI002FFD082F
MNTHHTKGKADLAVAKTIADLTVKGYVIFTPLICEHLPFDLVAWKENNFLKIQVKYSSIGRIFANTSWNDKHGNHKRQYQKDDFDYYAIYLPDKDRVIYPSFDYRGIIIRTDLPNISSPFYWWEDFLEIKSNVFNGNIKDFQRQASRVKMKRRYSARPKSRKVERPSKEELHELVWTKPTAHIAQDFGVSDKAVEKWCKAYEIEKPPRGYWAKLYSSK